MRRSTTMLQRRRLLLAFLLALAAVLGAAAAARAEAVVLRDDEGRPMTFDVRADADLEWYGALLRGAAHGDEIATVTTRIVAPEDVASYCGAAAAACYREGRAGALLVVPAGRGDGVARIVLHEYAHHLDGAWAVDGVREPNGTPSWWVARGIDDLLRSDLVAFDYSRGWGRSIGEIFAEDYAQIHVGGRYAIRWLSPPDDALRSSLLAELRGSPPARPTTPARQPLVVVRRGTLAPAARRALPFQLLGPGRRVTFTASVGGTGETGRRARLELLCDGNRVASRTLSRNRRSVTLDVRNLGPATCEVAMVSASASSYAYVLRLRLAIER